MTDPNGTKATAVKLGSVGAAGISHSNSVGGTVTSTPSYVDKIDWFSFDTPAKGEYLFILRVPSSSFSDQLIAEMEETPSQSYVGGFAVSKSSFGSGGFRFISSESNENYALKIERSGSLSQKVDYSIEIDPINLFPDSILVYDLQNSYNRNEVITLNQLYVNDPDGWDDVKKLSISVADSTGQTKKASTSSFTRWDGGTTWAQTKLNLPLTGLTAGTYTVTFEATDAYNIPTKLSRQITITDPLTGTAPTTSMSDPVYRFYNKSKGFHFYTASSAERDSIIGNLPQYQYEGAVFNVAATQKSSSQVPLFRFYNTAVGNHFYTTAAAERDSIIANLPQYKYEGTAFYVNGASANSGTDVFRFYNTQTGAHFFTANLAERDNVITSLPYYAYEGAAFEVVA